MLILDALRHLLGKVLPLHLQVHLHHHSLFITIHYLDEHAVLQETNSEGFLDINFASSYRLIVTKHFIFIMNLHVVIFLWIFINDQVITNLICKNRQDYAELSLFVLRVSHIPFKFHTLLILQMQHKTLCLFKIMNLL